MKKLINLWPSIKHKNKINNYLKDFENYLSLFA